MKDQSKKKQVLIQELVYLRERIVELEQSELERKQAEEALKQSEKRFRDIADNAAAWVWEVNAEGKYTYSSPVVEQLLGYKPEEILNKHFYDLFHPEDREELRKAAFEVFTNKKPFREFLNRNLHKNGETVWLSTSGVPILDEKGNLMGYRGADTDITGRKRAEEVLQISLIKYQALFHTLPIGVTLSDKAGKIIDSNGEAERLLGLQREAQVKRTIDGQEWRIIRPDGSPMPADEYASVRAMKENRLIENVEMGIIKGEGDVTWINVTAAPIPLEDYGVVIAYSDITERKKAQDTLAKSEALLREAQGVTHIGHWELDTSTMTPTWSEEIFHIFGLDPEEGEPSFEAHQKVTHPDDWGILNNAVTTSIVEGIPFNIEFRILRPDKTIRWMHSTGYPKKDSEGRIVSVFGTAQDITDRKLMENALQESELRYRELFENMWSGVSVYETRNNGEDFIFKDYNVAAEMLDKTPRGQAIGRSVVDVFPGVKDFGLFDVFQRVYRTGKSERHPLTFYKDEKISGWRENYVYKLPSGEIVAVFEDITEYKQAEEELRESEENFRRSMDESPLGVRIVTIEGETIYANRAILDIYGYDSIEELRTTPLKKRYTPESFAEYQIRMEKRKRGDYYPSEYDISIVRKDGEVRHLHVFRKEVLWGGEKQFQVLYNDITKLTKQRKEIEYLASFPLLNPIMIVEVSKDRKVIFCNPSMKSVLDKMGTDDPCIFIPKDIWKLYNSTDKTRKSAYVRELQINDIVFLENIYFTPEFNSLRIYATDITERKRAEEALRESEELYKTLAEKSMAGVYVVQDGNFRFINSNAASYAGYTREELLDQEAGLLVSPEDRKEMRQDAEAMLRGEKSSPYEYRIITKQGETRWIMEIVTSILYGGRPAILGSSMDITEHKRAAEAIKASHQQLRALAGRLQSVREEQRKEIAREIHDEFGGALTGLKIDLSFLASSGPNIRNKTKRDSFLSKVLAMSKLIDETIGTVRRLVTELRPSILDDFGLLAALEWQLWEFQKRTGIQSEFVSTLEYVNMGEELTITVFRIFQEALTNVARHANATNVIATLYKEADSLVLKVEDNGKGISADDIHNTKSIGLIGMRERAVFLGGTVNFSGEPHKGTTVSVQFPFES